MGVSVNQSVESQLSTTPVKLEPVELDVFKELPFEYDAITEPLSLNQPYNVIFISGKGISYNSGKRYQLFERVQPIAMPTPADIPLLTNTTKADGAAAFYSVSVTGIVLVTIEIGLTLLSIL